MTVHIPILLRPIRDSLIEPFQKLPADSPPHWLVDCTLGGGGHASAFADAFRDNPALARHKILVLDQDPAAVEAGRARFARELSLGLMEFHHSRFSEARQLFAGRPVLGLLADLGFSSDQIEDPSRGLSFQTEGPLDMRLDPTRGRSAREYLARVNEPELEGVLREYGEERFAGRIARVIVESRRESKLPRTSLELAELIRRAVPPNARHGRIHAATRSFQALRIVVNEELEELDSLLGDVILGIETGGRAAILSFHSLEDRRVKVAFRSDGWTPLSKKPLEADEEEIRTNPRSRSAKLRIAERTIARK